MKVLAIDPGTTESGVIIWDGSKVLHAEKITNNAVLSLIRVFYKNLFADMAIEQIRSYGQPVGQEIFDTCVWCGRFEQEWLHLKGNHTYYIPRIEVKKHICHRHIAKDGEIRQALIDRFGPKPTRKKPNPVYGGYKLANDEWQAFALAVTWFDRKEAWKSGGMD